MTFDQIPFDDDADEVQTWKGLALSAISDMRHYIEDVDPSRRYVSLEGYEADAVRLELATFDPARLSDDVIKRLIAALEKCAAPFDTGPTTMQMAPILISTEFQRRLNIAAMALTTAKQSGD